MNTWHEVLSLTGRVPSGVWVALMIANVALTIMMWRVARLRIRRAGARAAHPERFSDGGRKRDVALTVASLVPAGLFWLMVLAGSFQGLVAFGTTVLDWNGGAEFLVPGTLDGVSVTFAFLAFRAVHKRRDPTRCFRVVWVAALSSATVNFAYEYGHTHNVIAGGYLALLSLFGMVIFHEFLAQFEEGAEYVRRNKRPPYGLRWLTAPSSTFQAFIAWENFPPADGTPATVRNGLENLERVWVIKRRAVDARVVERHARDLAAARRKAELAAAKADPILVPATALADDGVDEQGPAAPPVSASATPASVGPPVPRVPRSAPVADVRPEDSEPAEVKVPATAAKITEWAQTWVQMCADGEFVFTALSDDDYARTAYGVSGRLLRSIRTAALSGALARRATELGAELPEGYAGEVPQRVNGHEFAGLVA